MSTALLAPISQTPRFDEDGNPENVMAEDGCGFANAAPHIQFDMLTKPQFAKHVKATDFWDEDEWDFNQYDLLVLYPQVALFFGGHCPPKMVKYVKALMNYGGELVFYQHDPIHLKINFLQDCYNRIFESKSPLTFTPGFSPYDLDQDKMRSKIPMTDMKSQISWSAHPNRNAPMNANCSEFVYHDTFREIFRSVRQQKTSLFRDNGICYVGVKRPQRLKRLEKLGVLDDIDFLGPISGQGRSTTVIDANVWMRGYSHTLVLGDEGHTNTGINHRLLQGLAAECVCLIDSKLDPHRTLILDPDLREALYFEDGDDLKRKYVFTLSEIDDIIELQNKELSRILAESNEDLVARTTI